MSHGPPSLDLPIADPAEVAAFLKTVPMAVDRERFTAFVLGFPHRYLSQTPRAEIVKHYALAQSGAGKSITSALSADGALWKLCIICQDRRRLFSRLAGALSVRGMSIVDAEAFANERGMVFDLFRFADSTGRLGQGSSRRELQALLESAATDDDAEPPVVTIPAEASISFDVDQEVHPTATWLRLQSPDFSGLLHLVSRTFSDAGCNIEMAFVRTPGHRADDEFYLTCGGNKVDEATLARIGSVLCASGTKPASSHEKTSGQ